MLSEMAALSRCHLCRNFPNKEMGSQRRVGGSLDGRGAAGVNTPKVEGGKVFSWGPANRCTTRIE